MAVAAPPPPAPPPLPAGPEDARMTRAGWPAPGAVRLGGEPMLGAAYDRLYASHAALAVADGGSVRLTTAVAAGVVAAAVGVALGAWWARSSPIPPSLMEGEIEAMVVRLLQERLQQG